MSTINRFSLIITIIAVLVTACSSTGTGTSSSVPQTTTPTILSLTPSVPATEIPQKTPSETPSQSSDVAVLVIPEGADPEQAQAVSMIIQGLADETGLEVQSRTDISPTDIRPEVKVVIALAPFNGLAELAQAAPQVQFLGIGLDTQPAANLSSLQVSSGGPGDLGFVAGYLAALVTPEWRTAIMGISDTPDGSLTSQGYLNGVKFFCGLCRQTYPPYYEYPMYSLLPANATDDEWRTAADSLITQAVKTIYLAPGAGEDLLPEYLTSQGINIITSSTPNIQSENVIAVVSADLGTSLKAIWPKLLGEKEASSSSAQIMVSNINPEILTPGKQRLLDDLITQLEQGFIDTGVQQNNP